MAYIYVAKIENPSNDKVHLMFLFLSLIITRTSPWCSSITKGRTMSSQVQSVRNIIFEVKIPHFKTATPMFYTFNGNSMQNPMMKVIAD